MGLPCLKTRSHTSIVPEVEEVKKTAGLVGLQQPSVSGDISYLAENTTVFIDRCEWLLYCVCGGSVNPMWSSG